MDVTKEEAEVITLLRNLPPASRERVLRMLRDLVVEGEDGDGRQSVVLLKGVMS